MAITYSFFERIIVPVRNFLMGILILTGLFVNAQTPVAYYPFSGNANDAAGTNHGTVNGATLTSDRFGNANSAYSFDGVNDFVGIGSLNFATNDYTISYWVNVNTNNADMAVVSGNDPTALNQTFIMSGFSGGVGRFLHRNPSGTIGGVDLAGIQTLTLGQWKFVTCVKQGTTLTYYVNGVVDNTITNVAATNINSAIYLEFGRLMSSTFTPIYHFNGAIDEVKIFNSALTGAQVLAEFNANAPVANYASQFGNSVLLNGNNDHINIPFNGNTLSQLTIEFWFKKGNGVDAGIMQWASDNLNSAFPWILLRDYGTSVTLLSDNAYRLSAVGLTTGTWYHMAVTYDGTNWKMLLNGNPIGSSVAGIGGEPSTNIHLGNGYPTFWNGTLDEVRIWNTARTQAEIQTNMNAQLAGTEAGLVGYWDMNRSGQGEGLTVDNKATATGAALNGTTFGTARTPVFVSGTAPEPDYASQFGNSIVMNGANDFVDCGNNTAYNITSALTMEAWIKPTAFGILNQIVHKGGTGAPGVDRDGFHLRLDAGNMINFDIANGSSIEVVGTPVTTADLNQWMHVAGVYDGFTIKIYRNGQLMNTVITSQSITHVSTPFLIGKRSDGYNFEGSIDEVRIWNTARSATDIQNNMNAQLAGTETGLVGYWDMNRSGQGTGLTVENKATGTGAVLNGTTQGTATTPVFSNEFNIPALIAYYPLNGNSADSSGNNLHGTIIGSVPGATDRNGNANGAVSFNGNTANRIEVDDNILLHTSSITIAAWVKLNSLGGIKTFVDKPMGNSVSDSWHLGTENSNFSCWHMNDPVNFNPYSQVTSPASTGQWHYVVNTFDNNSKQHKLYIDGVLKTTNTFNSSIGYDNSKLYIGAAIESGGLNFPMDGLIDEVKIYNKALTAAEITNELMNDLTASKPGSGNAIDFNSASNTKVTIPNISLNNKSFTIEFWQKRNALPGNDMAFSQGTAAQNSGLAIGYYNSSFIFSFYASDLFASTVADTQWHHWTCVYDNSISSPADNRFIYRDGILVGANRSDSPYLGTGNLNMGVWLDPTLKGLDGSLDEVRIWNTALTETQIRDRMCRKITSSDPVFNNLAAYYNFDESSGDFVFDATANANHGILINGPARVISGAAIGDTSVHNYVSSGFPGASLALNGQDNLSVVFTAGTYSSTAGTHIYGVKKNPNSQNGVNALSDNNKYFGVFTANISNPDYTTTYDYTGNPSVDLSNENDLRLFNRSNNASTAWTNTNATLNTTNKTLLTSNQQGEFMIGTTPLQETIVLRSGTGNFGQADANVKMLVGPSGTYFPNVFTSADFTAARTGPPALVTQNHPAWIASLPADPDARWINNVGNTGGGNTCLYAIDFMVNGNVTNADITFNFAIDNVLGGNLNQGVYINGQPLSGNTANIGNYSEPFTINRNDIVALLQQGLNTLYVNATDLGPPGAVIFSASLNLIYSDYNPGFIAAPQSSCLAALPQPLTGTVAFNTTTDVTYQWQDSTATSVWTNISGATNGTSFAPPVLSSPTYYRRLATLNNTTLISNVVLLNFQNAINPGVVPLNSWNLYAYDGTSVDSVGVTYKGSYSRNTLGINTITDFGSGNNPSVATGYEGCNLSAPNNQWSLYAKRKGFPEGSYVINISQHDDEIKIFKDGVLIITGTCCSNLASQFFTLGTLNSNSVLECRVTNNAGGAGYLVVDVFAQNLAGGTIAGNQINCGPFTPGLLTNTHPAYGGSSTTINYQWQTSTDNLVFTDISGATSSTYQPEFVTDFIYIRRKAFNANAEEAFSNTVLLKNALPAIPVVSVSGATTFCSGGSTILTSSATTGNIWSNGATTQSIIVTTGGSYTVTANSEGCTSAPSEAVVVTVLPLPEVSISGSSAFCPGGSAQLTASESISYLWNTGATTQSITVTVPGFYSVNVPGENGCEGTAQFTVEPFPLPAGPVSLLLPADSTYGIADPVTFSWSAAANATSYDLYIWRTNQQKPAIPAVSGITGTSHTYTEYLNKNYIYNWQVVARNLCYQSESATRLFSFYVFTDLTVEQVTIPSTAVAGETVSLGFTVKNIGSVGTGIIPWKDDIYLSSSPVFDISTALKVASVSNKSSLSAGMSYTNSVNIVLPQYLEGAQYVFVKTDANNIIQETDETNNELGSQNAMLVSLPPYPDITAADIQSLSGSIIPGQMLTVGWNVENIGDAPAMGGWSQRISIVSGTQLQILGFIQNTETLQASGSIAQSTSFMVPNDLGLEGNVYLQVRLTPNPGLIEKPNGASNNTILSNETFVLEKRLTISLPQQTLNENATASLQGMLYRSGNRDEALLVNFSVSQENRINVPLTVNIPANQAGAMFFVSAINNEVTEGNIDLEISAMGNNYPTAVTNLTIIDDEVPGLSVSLNKIEASEGETFQLTVSRSVLTNNPLNVTLSTGRPNQITLPGALIIQGGESFATIDIPVVNDNVPELTENITINASSVGFVPASASISIVDNDIPLITLTIDPVSVSEAGGPYASWGTVTLAQPAIGNLVIQLSANLPGQLYFPSQISIPNGQIQKQFNIGVVDNSILDGDREIAITAAVFIPSCGCGAPSGTVGESVQNITILDNDGPSLSASSNPFVVFENQTNAGILTITRNTLGGSEITLTIEHNGDDEIQIPATAIIPEGATSVDVPFNTLDDGIEDGSQIVSVIVSSGNYSSGICWIMVSDRNLPDFVAKWLTLSKNIVLVNEQIQIGLTVANDGFALGANDAEIKIYRSDDNVFNSSDVLISTAYTPTVLNIGDSIQISANYTPTDEVGDFFIIAQVNGNGALNELVTINNTSTALPISILPDYNATATVVGDIFNGTTPIVITGLAESVQKSPALNKAVDVYIVVNGARRVFSAVSDVNGEFSVTFFPLNGEAGDYYVGACYPGQGLDEAQDEFTILGAKHTATDHIIWDVFLDETKPFSLEIQNLCGLALNNLRLQVLSAPQGCNVNSVPIPQLAGNSAATLSYTVNALQVSNISSFQEIKLQLTTDEGTKFKFSAWYYCRAVKGNLKIDPVSLNKGMVRGITNYSEFVIRNNGMAETGEINILLPQLNWMSIAGPSVIPSLLPGETAAVTLRLSPGNDLQLNNPITGQIAISATNANSVAVPFSFEPISVETGNLLVTVEDEYTYFSESSPNVEGATVILTHPYTGQIIAQGLTDENGQFLAENINEGNYMLKVNATKHFGTEGIVYIEKGRINTQRIFLSMQAISYSWEVVPTQIEDEYEIKLVTTFATNVPAPVIVINMPDSMPALDQGEVFPFIMTITNHGLITAKDAVVRFPDDAEYEFIANVNTFDILPQASVNIPVIMKRKATAALSGKEVRCKDFAVVEYEYECGPDNQMRLAIKEILFMSRYCAEIRPGAFPCFNCLVDGPGYDPGTRDPIDVVWPFRIPTDEYEYKDMGCDTCLVKLLNDLISCAVGGNYGYIETDVKGIGSFAKKAFKLGKEAKKAFKEIPCSEELQQALICKLESELGGLPFKSKAVTAELLLSYEYLLTFQKGYDAVKTIGLEIFSNPTFINRQDFQIFSDSIASNLLGQIPISTTRVDELLISFADSDIPQSEIFGFVDRWNLTIEAYDSGIYSPTTEYPDIIDETILSEYMIKYDSVVDYTLQKGYTYIEDLYNEAVALYDSQVSEASNSVCATVSVQFSQKLTMTREAFEGTLKIFNGHDSESIKNISLDLEIKDENGIIRNDLFQINTKSLNLLTGIDGSGELNAQTEGSAVVQFIPERGAAPDVVRFYSFGGKLSYLDPFTGEMFEQPLFPVRLQVNPSPNLYIDYFMQRDILGDDALTEPIEPMIPAELAVMIDNQGAGTAYSVNIESAQPEIIDNDKGLLIDFNIVGSNLSGKPTQLGLLNVDFGDIEGGKIGIGQWWFTSSLLGHFISYEVSVNHLNSFGNPDLSLVSDVQVHELIRSVTVYGGLYDTISDFLVNDLPDNRDLPDALYYSSGLVAPVFEAATSATDGTVTINDLEVELTVTPSLNGWNYTKLNDPGNGLFRIVSCTREDGQEIPIENIWLTYVTIPDGGEPTYENKLHFVDTFDDFSPKSYTVVFEAIDQNIPKVVAINGVPESGITDEPVTNLEVVFNKPIDPATYNFEDMTLKNQGGPNLMDNTVIISQLNDTTFNVDISTKTAANGFYVFTVQTAGITDLIGNPGQAGKQISWIQAISTPAIDYFFGLPEVPGAPIDTLLVLFNMPINAATFTKDQLLLTDGADNPISTSSLVITSESFNNVLFKISGLLPLTSGDGNYKLTFKVTEIQGETGLAGLQDQTVEWAVCQIEPPVADAGDDNSVCIGESYQLNGTVQNAGSFIWTTSGTGTFDNDHVLTPLYTASQEDIIAGSVQITLTAEPLNACADVATSTLILTIKNDVEADAGDDATICQNTKHQLFGTVINASGIQWITSGNGTFSNSVSLTPVYTPGTQDIFDGFVTLLLLADPISPCITTDTSTMMLTIQKLPTAYAGANQTICEDQQIQLQGTAQNHSSVFWSGGTSGTFSDRTILNPVYVLGQLDIERGYVAFLLTVQASNPCFTRAFSIVRYDIVKKPVANAGADATICEDGTHQLSGSAQNQSSVLWTTSGNGTFGSAGSLTTVYTPGVTDITSGTVTLTLTASAISPCLVSASDSKILQIQKLTLANAGADATICENGTHQLSGTAQNQSSVLWTTSGNGTFGSAGSLTTVYTPGTADIVAGSVTLTLTAFAISPCRVSASDSKILQIQKLPLANAGTDATICENGTHQLSGSAQNQSSVLWTTSGNGTFGSASSLTTVYTPGVTNITSGTVTLTLTASAISPCTVSASDSKILQIQKLPLANAGIDATICENGTHQLDGSAQNQSSLLWTTSGNGTFSSAGSPTTFYTPGVTDITSGTATLTLTASAISPCTVSASDTKILQIQKLPLANAGEDGTICHNEIYSLNGSVDHAQAFLWTTGGDGFFDNPNSLVTAYSPGGNDILAGDALLTLTAEPNQPCSVSASDQLNLHINYCHDLSIPAGWSGLSTFVEPVNPDLETIFSDILNDLTILYSQTGVFWPGQNINTIGQWNLFEGYTIKVANQIDLRIAGSRSVNRTLQLSQGWNLIPVLSECDADVTSLFAGTGVVVVKEVAGWQLYWPALNINTLGNLHSGKAYFVLINQAATITFPACNGEMSPGTNSTNFKMMEELINTSPWNVFERTAHSFTLGIPKEVITAELIKPGDYLGAFDQNGQCYGLVKWEGDNTTLTTFGDDPTTTVKDGFVAGETLYYKLFVASTAKEYELEATYDQAWPQKDGLFVTNGLSAISGFKLGATQINESEDFGVLIYPNPADNELFIDLDRPREIEITLLDVQGKEVLKQLLTGLRNQLDISGLRKGVYFLKLEGQGVNKIEKVVRR